MVLRSGAKQGQPRPAPADEIDYSTRLNRALPPDIRVLGWADVANDFHARCTSCYHYPAPRMSGYRSGLGCRSRSAADSRARLTCAAGQGLTPGRCPAGPPAALRFTLEREALPILLMLMSHMRGGYAEANLRRRDYITTPGLLTAAHTAQQAHARMRRHDRFGASTREYKYFLLLDGSEDIDAMRAGAAAFVGEHDFRNFCKVATPSTPV